MDFLTLAKERYSCRSLTDQPVSQEAVAAIIQAALLAPTACNYQPFKIWAIRSEEGLAKVKGVCKQAFIKPAPVIFVIGADRKKAWVRDYDGMNFADVDAAIAASHMMLEIQSLGLGTTWIGHFDPEKLKQEFPDMKEYSLIALFAVGYPAEDAGKSPMHDACRPESELVQDC